MTVSAFDHVLPWTEEEYLALGETSDRVELFDGSLYVSPAPTFRHQTIARRLANQLDQAAARAGLGVFEAVNIRLKPGRIAIPDVVIIRAPDTDLLVGEAANVRLIAEITSPSNAATDRVLKMHYYAEAGIPWYLLVDPEPTTLTLFLLDGGGYVTHATAGPGEMLRLTEPVAAQIDPSVI